MQALTVIDTWQAPHAAAAAIRGTGEVATSGDLEHDFSLASVTKLVTAYAVLIALDDGALTLDEPAGPPGSTVRHLLAHASGLGFEGATPISRPAATRIYSNPGFDQLAAHLAQRTGVPFERYLSEQVLEPLGMTGARLVRRPSEGLVGTLPDLVRFAAELLRPALVRRQTLSTATEVVFPGLAGVLPGVGRFDPLDWGLGFELRDGKSPHWTGTLNSPQTFGHFGGAGTFLWVDPAADLALVCLTDRAFGPWALEAWPALSDAVLADAGDPRRED